MEKKVLLLDLDFRNPSLGSLLMDSVPYEKTLNALYRGDADAGEIITSLNGNVDFVPTILERRELPIDEAMLSLIRKLGAGYDYVIMDTSPVGEVADTINLKQIAAGAVFVARYDTLCLQEIQDAVNRLKKSGTKVIGCLITDVNQLGRFNYLKEHRSAIAEKPAGVLPERSEVNSAQS